MSCSKLLHLKWIISYDFKLKFNKNLKRSFLNENGTFWNVVWICLEPHVGLWLIWLLVLQVQNLCRVVQCSSDNGISPVKMLKKQPHSKYHQFNPTTYCPTLTTHKGKFLIKTSFGKISIFFSELFFVVCSYSVGNIISEVSSSIICISGWVIQIHEIHHTFQANRPKPFWWCILELKPPSVWWNAIMALFGHGLIQPIKIIDNRCHILNIGTKF